LGEESADPADEIAHEKFVTMGVETSPASCSVFNG